MKGHDPSQTAGIVDFLRRIGRLLDEAKTRDQETASDIQRLREILSEISASESDE